MPAASETTLFALCAVTVLALLAGLARSDLKQGILPDRLTAALALCALFLHGVTGWQSLSLVNALAGGMAAGAFLLILRQISIRLCKKDGIGLGDVKLAAAGGLLLGLPHVMAALCLGAVFGILHGFVIWRQQAEGVALAKINVPAGLGLCLGIAIVWLMQYGFVMK